MNPAFNELQADKRENILNAAYDEFAAQGYEKASTNNIVKNAGISKGVLFYYFNTKEELFNDLIKISLEFYLESYVNKIDISERDFMKRFTHISMLKYRATHENLHAFNFVSSLYLNQDKTRLPGKLAAQFAETADKFIYSVYSDIDASLFRKDIPEKRVLSLIKWSMEGYERDLTERIKRMPQDPASYNVYWDEFYAFLDDLKKVFYSGDDREVKNART